MTVIEKINEINEVIKEVFEFTQKDEKIREDFYEYLSTIGAREIPLNQMEKEGLIIREASLNDKRKINIFLTSSGYELFKILDKIIQAHLLVYQQISLLLLLSLLALYKSTNLFHL